MARQGFDREAGVGVAGGEKKKKQKSENEKSPLPPFAKGGNIGRLSAFS
jgi:hypothetical protein